MKDFILISDYYDTSLLIKTSNIVYVHKKNSGSELVLSDGHNYWTIDIKISPEIVLELIYA